MTNREAYSTVIAGTSFPNQNSTIMKAISCVISFTSGTNLDTPDRDGAEVPDDVWPPGRHEGDHPRDGRRARDRAGGAPGRPATTTRAPPHRRPRPQSRPLGTEIYTIGFLDTPGSPPACSDASGTWHSKTVTDLLANMATASNNNGCVAAENTDNDHFFCEPKSDDLTQSFKSAALALTGGKSKLIQLYPLPYVASVAPNIVFRGGGTAVTITGQYFTGAFGVKFGGSNALSFTVNSDTSISAVAPPGVHATQGDVRVSTGGGTSPIVGGDKVTWN